MSLDYLDSPPPTAAWIASGLGVGPVTQARLSAMLLRYVPIGAHQRVVDVGCGTGDLVAELAQMLGPTATVIGVDRSPEALEHAAARAAAGLSNVSFLLASDQTIDLPDASCDLAVSNLGHTSVSNLAPMVAECGRIVAPGGTLAMTTTVRGSLNEFVALFRAVLAEHNDARALDLLAKHEAEQGTVATISARLEASGFRVVRVVEETATLRFVDGSAFFRYLAIRARHLPMWRLMVQPSDEARIFATVEQALNTVAAQHGELTMTLPMLYVEGRRQPPVIW